MIRLKYFVMIWLNREVEISRKPRSIPLIPLNFKSFAHEDKTRCFR